MKGAAPSGIRPQAAASRAVIRQIIVLEIDNQNSDATGIERAVAILEIIAREGGAAHLKGIAASTGLGRSTVHNLIKMPLVVRPRPVTSDAGGKMRPETIDPAPNCFPAGNHATFGKQILDISRAQREPIVAGICER